MANGGLLLGDYTRAQVGKAGQPVLFAEAGDGDESFIPWAPQRRPQAAAVLQETADAFGYDVVPMDQIAQAVTAAVGNAAPKVGTQNFNVTRVDHGVTDIQREMRRLKNREMTATIR